MGTTAAVLLAVMAEPLEAELAPVGYGWALAKMLLALALVCLAAYALLWLLRRYLGAARTPGGMLRVLDRCPLAQRQTLWLVEAAGRVLLLGTSEHGVTRLAELDPGSLAPATAAGQPPIASFSAVLRRTARAGRPGRQGEGP